MKKLFSAARIADATRAATTQHRDPLVSLIGFIAIIVMTLVFLYR